MKSIHLGLHVLLFSALIMGFPAQSLQAQDAQVNRLPDYLAPLRLQKYDVVPFHLRFNGYELLNGKYAFQIVLGDVPGNQQPPLKAIGDPLGYGGYVVGAFHQNIVNENDPTTKLVVKVDESTLELDNPDLDLKITLNFRREVNAPETMATFVMLPPSGSEKKIEVWVGKSFVVPESPGMQFLLRDAGLNGATIRNATTKEEYSIPRLAPDVLSTPSTPQVAATTPPVNGVADASKGGSNSDQQVVDQLNADSLVDANQAVAQNPNFAPAYEDRGFAKLRLGDLVGAIADFSRAIEISPKNVDFYRDRGDAKLKQNDLKGSISDFEMVVSLDPDAGNAYPNRDAVQAPDTGLDKKIEETTKDIALKINSTAYVSYGMRGDAKIGKGDLAGAKADIDQAIALNPKYSGAFNSRTILKEKMGDWDGALADANQAVALDPKEGYLYTSRGQVELHQGDFDSAIADDTKAIALDPTLIEAYIDRGWAKHQKGDLIGAITDYKESHEPHKSVTDSADARVAAANQKIALTPTDPWAFANRASGKAIDGDLTGAIADYSQAIALDPKNIIQRADDYFYLRRGEAKDRQGDSVGAIADFGQSITLDPKKPDGYLDRAKAYDKQGDFGGAIADLNQAITIDPKNSNYYSRRAEVKFHQGDIDGAIADYTQAIALDSNHARYYTSRGEAKDKKGDADGAIADYSQAISLDPEDAYAYAYRGRAKAIKGDWDGAIADCDKALEWDSALAVAYYNRGLAKDKKGDHEGAVADYNQAISNARSRGETPPSGPKSILPPVGGKVMMGTGFFVTTTGYILTDNHVVKGASTIRVKVGSSIMSAILAAADATNDIALLKITGTYPCLPLGDSSGTSLGQTVFTVGFPEPQLQGLSPKLTKGEISSLAGMQDNPGMFQISVPVQPGNSGGCLVDESGNVVGLIEATLSTVETAKQSGDLLQNVNYATKINLAKKLVGTVQEANSGLSPLDNAPAPFTEKVKAVEQATVFIIADSSGVALPANHLYTDSAGNTFSVSESDYQRLYPQSLALDAETRKLNQLNGQVEAESRRIQQDRQNLDNTDAQAVANFNAEVDNHNAFLAQVKQETEIFNAAVDRFNAELKRVGTPIK